MLAILNSKPILTKNGKPAHGRINVFQKDTNQKASVYTYDANKSLVAAQNPIYTDSSGFPEYEVILDDQIYSMVVEEYLGNYSDPKSDEREEMWEVCNSYYEGRIDSAKDSETIYTATSLPDVDPEKGSVNVVGYHTPFDCGARTFVWDSESIDTVDNGYVFRSNKSSKGRWLLVNDLPFIPSEYYGVYPGHLENMNALTRCPETLGALFSIKVPNCIKFATGDYELTEFVVANSNGRSRSIIVDNKTCFGDKYAVITNGVTVLGEAQKDQDKYIGKFLLPANSMAKYSWFPNLESFITCGSEHLVVDSYGIDNVLKNKVFAKYKTFEFVGGKIQWTAENGGSLTLENCNIIGEKFHATDGTTTVWWNGFSKNTHFKNMEYSDKFVLGTANAIETNCTKHIDNFANEANYFAICINNDEPIDLQGHSLGSVEIDCSDRNVRISNGTIQNLAVVSPRCDLTIENCTINNLDMSVYGIENLTINNSTVSGNIEAATVVINDSHILSAINCLDVFSARNGVFDGNIEAYTTHLYYCTVNGIVWPKSEGGKITCVFVGNTFTTNSYIKLASKNKESQVKLNGHFENNAFFSSSYNGLYVQVFVQDYRYLHDSPMEHSWTWQGNSGTCLQTYCNEWRHLDSTTGKRIDDVRFISFGIPWRTEEFVHEPYIMKLSPIAGNPWVYCFRYEDETDDYGISKYNTNDYFAHRFTISNFGFNDDFFMEVETCNRGH